MSMPAAQIHSTASLAQLLQGYADAPDIPLAGIASDSRRLRDGFLFLACKGINSHGLAYLEQALAAGARAVAWEPGAVDEPTDIDVPVIAVENLNAHLGDIANRFYGYPSEHLKVVGITGTNGKTTVAWLISQCLRQLDERCGYLGTLGYGVDDVQGAEGMTTPAAIELHGRLADFIDQGAAHAAIEVSSHALSEGRVDGVRF